MNPACTLTADPDQPVPFTLTAKAHATLANPGGFPPIVCLCGSTRFIDEFNRQDNRQVRGLTPETEKELERYSWPGNVRELRNVIQRAVVLSGTGLIASEHLPDNVLRGTAPATGAAAGSVTPIREMERDLILRALDETNQDKRKAAQLLGISLKTLYNKLAKYGIQAVKSARLT